MVEGTNEKIHLGGLVLIPPLAFSLYLYHSLSLSICLSELYSQE